MKKARYLATAGEGSIEKRRSKGTRDGSYSTQPRSELTLAELIRVGIRVLEVIASVDPPCERGADLCMSGAKGGCGKPARNTGVLVIQ